MRFLSFIAMVGLFLFMAAAAPGNGQASEAHLPGSPAVSGAVPAGDEPEGDSSFKEPELARARVLAVEEQQAAADAGPTLLARQIVTVRVLTGTLRGREIQVENVFSGNPAYDINLRVGDEVFLALDLDGEELTYGSVADFVRDRYLLYLAGIFVLSLLVFGGLKGFKSVIVLALTAAGVLYGLLPMVLRGYNPIIVTVLITAAVTAVTMLVVAGASRKAAAATLGTVGGVIVAAVLAVTMGRLAHLVGMSAQEAQLLYFADRVKLDFRGLLFSGMILGALGATMDVGMSIASAVEEVKKANPRASARQLVTAGMNVGRDVMGTMSNTLILAYTGGSLPLLLLLMVYGVPVMKITNLDMIATEVVRALAGSIGLIFAIPITALAGGMLLRPSPHHGDHLGAGASRTRRGDPVGITHRDDDHRP